MSENIEAHRTPGPVDITPRAVAVCLLDVLNHNVSVDEVLTESLADVGVESWAFTAFLSRLEREFDFHWDYGTEPDVFVSVHAITAYLNDRLKSVG